MAVKDALVRIAGLTGKPLELDEADLQRGAVVHDRDGDPTTITEAELDEYLSAQDVGWMNRKLAQKLLFAERVAGPDRRLSPKEAMGELLRHFGDGAQVQGVTLRRR